MKNRREFFKRSAFLSMGIVVSTPLFANSKKSKNISYPGIIFTEDEQGIWEGKAGSHVPKVTVSENQVTLLTDHGMSESHYIVKHTLVDEAGTMIGSKTFYTDDEKTESTFELPAGFTGVLFATSFCNKHDFWLNEFSV